MSNQLSERGTEAINVVEYLRVLHRTCGERLIHVSDIDVLQGRLARMTASDRAICEEIRDSMTATRGPL